MTNLENVEWRRYASDGGVDAHRACDGQRTDQ